MTEIYPTDAELNELSGTTDEEQEVLYVTTAESPYYTSFYKLLYRLLDVARRAGDLRVYKDGDLTCGVRAGKVFNGDYEVDYAGSTGNSLTNNQTNYIYLTASGATPTLTINTAGFPIPSVTPHIPLATIVTSGGLYDHSDITDYRARAFLSISGAAGGNLGLLDWQESLLDELDFTSAEPGAPSLGDRYLNTGTGSSSGTAQSVTADRIYEWNGTNWTETTPTEGACAMVEDRDMLIGYNGAAWVDIGTFALLTEAQTFFAATDISGAEAETLTDASDADSLHYHITKAAATQTISADNFTITHGDAPVLLLTNDGGDHRVSDGTTAIANGTISGQKLRVIYVVANTKRVTIKDDANTKLSGDWHVAREEAWLELVWDGSDWLETGRGNNSATLDGYDSAGVGGILSSIGEYAYCSAVLGGGYNTVSAGYSVVVGGASNTASGLSSVVVGGSGNTASGEGAVAIGKSAVAAMQYQFAHASGRFAADGDAQVTEAVARIATTDQAFNEMFLDGSSARFAIVDEKLYAVTITIAARMDTGTTECAMFKRMLTIERTGGTVVLQNAAQTIGTDINPGADYNVQLTADDTNKSLKIEVKHDDGVGAKNVRWVASIEAVEIAYSD